MVRTEKTPRITFQVIGKVADFTLAGDCPSELLNSGMDFIDMLMPYTLPENFRPLEDFRMPIQGQSVNNTSRFLLYVSTSGQVMLQRKGGTGTKTDWLWGHGAYIVA